MNQSSGKTKALLAKRTFVGIVGYGPLYRCERGQSPISGNFVAKKTNHHYIPQLYLRGFSAGKGRQAQVFVFDSNTNKSFTTLVRNIGSRRYFNKVDAHGVGPDHVEDGMSETEAIIAPHLQKVIEDKDFPSPEHFNSIMNLMAMLSVRNPRLRSSLGNFHKDMVQRVMSISVSSKEIWERETKKMRDTEAPKEKGVTYEEIKQFHDEGNYKIVIDQTHLISLELKMIEPVVEKLSQRQWCFAIAPDGHNFITCDNPMVLTWSDNVKRPTWFSPGHGLQNTIVIFTLSPDLALVGTFEDLPVRVQYVGDQVTALNTAVAQHSIAQIYARDGNFRLRHKDRSNVGGFDLTRIFLGRT